MKADIKMLLTVKETAVLLRTNPATVYTLIHSGRLPALKLGSYKVRPESVTKFLEDCEGMDISDPYNVTELRNTAS